MASPDPPRHSKLSNSESIPNHEQVRYFVTKPSSSTEKFLLLTFTVSLITAFTYDLCSSKAFKCSDPKITFVVNTTYHSVFGARAQRLTYELRASWMATKWTRQSRIVYSPANASSPCHIRKEITRNGMLDEQDTTSKIIIGGFRKCQTSNCCRDNVSANTMLLAKRLPIRFRCRAVTEIGFQVRGRRCSS